MENKFPAWLEITTFFVLLVNLPLIFIETFPNIAPNLPVIPIEWAFTIYFTIDYLLRVFLAQKKQSYVLGIDGIVDLLATIPQYILALLPMLSGVYFLRMLRIGRFIVRGWRMARKGGASLHSTLDLKKHFAPNETVVFQTRTSRFHYLATYALSFTFIILAAAGAVLIHGPLVSQVPIVQVSLYVFIVLLIILLILKEFAVLSQRYAVTTHRILSSTQILGENVTSIALQHITDVTVQQRFLERFTNTGSLDVRTSGETTSMHLEGVRYPLRVKQVIQQDIIHGTATKPQLTNQVH